jgi:sulfopyruvate decarboxylase subunit beta
MISLLKNAGVDFTSSLPCEKFKGLLEMIEKVFFHMPLTREEEGVGISAGAALSGRRPAVFVQSSGIGNMMNALLSLTVFYELPLAIFISQRGVYKERIKAQVPMGQRLPGILRSAGIPYSTISTSDDFKGIEKKLSGVYKNNLIHAFLLSPAIFEKSKYKTRDSKIVINRPALRIFCDSDRAPQGYNPQLTRFEILKIITPYLDSKIVVCNLGIPSKELFHIKHQPSNFYMLGSMGMATPIGLGISLTSDKNVVVIDGDGSILMNPGSLATTAYYAPDNLTIITIDNSSYGSTGDQPTLTGSCVDLEVIARGFGIRNTVKVSGREELTVAMGKKRKGLTFIHALAKPGNKAVPNISLHHLKVKKQFQAFLMSK